jgi:hypothetical protein
MSPFGSQGGFRKMKARVKPARDGWLSALTAASTSCMSIGRRISASLHGER